MNDVNDFINWLDDHDPFVCSPYLKALDTGVIADELIDCHNAFKKGSKAMARMVEKYMNKVSLSRASRVWPLSTMKTTLHLENDESNAIDSNLLLQRLLTGLDLGNEDGTKSAFTYKLSLCPLSFFDENGIIRKTVKSKIYKIVTASLYSIEVLTDNLYVIDGG